MELFCMVRKAQNGRDTKGIEPYMAEVWFLAESLSDLIYLSIIRKQDCSDVGWCQQWKLEFLILEASDNHSKLEHFKIY